MKKHSLTIFLFLLSFQPLFSQDFMMQGWYWDFPKTCDGFNWSNTLNTQADLLQAGGFTYLWLPPLSKTSSGPCSNGYNPKDLYDLGEFGTPAYTGFGTRAQLDNLVAALNVRNIKSVADVVYNHRDGGKPEINTAVEGWIENMNCTKVTSGDAPYPSDRYRCFLPLGGASMNGAGDYYFKMRSASKHPNYYGRAYKLYLQTNKTGYSGNSTPLYETEGGGNGGGDCGQSTNPTNLQLGRAMAATLDNTGSCVGGCGIDEFKLTLSASDFNATDTLWMYFDTGGIYSDLYIHGLYSAPRAANIQADVKYQTYTDFTGLPSGQGAMNYLNFKPNGNPTQLSGDQDGMLFFYDIDQNVTSSQTVLFDWTNWLWSNAGMRGFRMDAVKHFPAAFVGNLLDNLHANGRDPGLVVGEIFDTNPTNLKNWINDVKANMDDAPGTEQFIQPRVFDFALRAALKAACDDFGNNVRNVFSSGIVNTAPTANGVNSVTFVNNHDYREDPAFSGNAPVQNDPMLAYSYILTDNRVGLPCVFYSDYFGIPLPHYPTVNLSDEISELTALHKNYIHNSVNTEYLNSNSQTYADPLDPPFFPLGTDRLNTTLFYQLSGTPANSRDVLIAINFAGEPLDMWHHVDTDSDNNGSTNFPVGTVFSRLTTNNAAPNMEIVGSDYRVHVQVPARSYALWVEGVATTYFRDLDGDGFGNAAVSTLGFSVPTGYVVNSTDCNDNLAAIYPGAPELCNGLDDDCSSAPESAMNAWTGSGDALNWSDLANWSDSLVPLECQDVLIPTGNTVIVPAAFPAVGRTLEVQTGAQLMVQPTGTMTIEN